MTKKTKAELIAEQKDKLTLEKKNEIVAQYEKMIAEGVEHNVHQDTIRRLQEDLQLVKDNLF